MLVNQKTKQHEKQHSTRIYLGNCSTYSHIYNEELITDAREVNSWLFRHCNIGTTSTNKNRSFGSIDC